MPSIPANTHPRRDIRAALIPIIQAAGFTSVGEPIYPSSIDHVAISTPLEEILTGVGEGSGMGSELTTRRLVIEIEIRMRQILLESELDKAARKIEIALAADTTIGERGRELRLERTETRYEGEIEKPDGVITLVYGFLYACDPRTFSAYQDPGA